MISEQQQEQASLYAFDALAGNERDAFEGELAANAELQQLVGEFRRCGTLLTLALPGRRPAPALKEKILRALDDSAGAPPSPAGFPAGPGFAFFAANDPGEWKALPVPGAFIKLLSVDVTRGYVVALGKLEPGTRYPAHQHTGSENLFLLTGDLHIGPLVMGPGDFHHSARGTEHAENYSVEGCTLLAVLSVDHALAKFVLA